jgi:hypothetical protein
VLLLAVAVALLQHRHPLQLAAAHRLRGARLVAGAQHPADQVQGLLGHLLVLFLPLLPSHLLPLLQHLLLLALQAACLLLLLGVLMRVLLALKADTQATPPRLLPLLLLAAQALPWVLLAAQAPWSPHLQHLLHPWEGPAAYLAEAVLLVPGVGLAPAVEQGGCQQGQEEQHYAAAGRGWQQRPVPGTPRLEGRAATPPQLLAGPGGLSDHAVSAAAVAAADVPPGAPHVLPAGIAVLLPAPAASGAPSTPASAPVHGTPPA